MTFKGTNLTMLALRNDEIVGSTILGSGGPFEPETLDYMLKFIRPGSVVVDAGWCGGRGPRRHGHCGMIVCVVYTCALLCCPVTLRLLLRFVRRRRCATHPGS